MAKKHTILLSRQKVKLSFSFSFMTSEHQALSTGKLTFCNMGLITTKPVFEIFDQVVGIPACSATETSYETEISPEASLGTILYIKGITKVLNRLCRCAGWSAHLLFANL